MPNQTSTINDTTIIDKNPLTRFIDPYSDFGFKFLFGKEPNKEFLIRFLNGIFDGRKVIIDIDYQNIEYKGPGKDYRKTIFDLYCTGDKGDKFIVEMQKAKVENFADRSIFYTSNLIQEQGMGMASDWDYLLPEIYFLAIMNFKFNDSHPDHFIHDVRLIEVNTGTQFYHKLNYIFIEAPKFNKPQDKLDNPMEEWMFILNNLKKIDEVPLSLRGKEEYKKVFEIAEVGNLTPEEMNEYQQSLKIQRDNNSALSNAKNEGKAEGKHEQAVEIAVKLKARNTPLEEIAELTGLSIAEIKSL